MNHTRHIGRRPRPTLPDKYKNFDKSIALVIGVNDYQDGIPQLRTPVNDADYLGKLLAEEHGYDTIILENPTFETIETWFTSEIHERVGENDRFLLYFAGHGIALTGDNGPEGFIVPADASIDNTASYFPMRAIHESLDRLSCRHALVVFDCCFAGTIRWSSTRNFQPLPDVIHEGRLRRYIEDPAWQAITSASADEVALDFLALGGRGEGEGEHSPFAEALFKALSGEADVVPTGGGDGIITATELYMYLRESVTNVQAIKNQTPNLWPLPKHDKGEYIFLAPNQEINIKPDPELNKNNNPYQGLKAYSDNEAHLFFGRESLTKELAQYVVEHPITVVTAASGTGKSSMVRAGLIPTLKSGIIKGNAGLNESDTGEDISVGEWLILPVIKPGKTPVAALKSGLIDAFPDLSSEFEGVNWAEDIHQLAKLLKRVSQTHPNKKMALVIDQFEELITLRSFEQKEGATKDHYLELLHTAIKEVPAFRLIVTVRTDFEGHFSKGVLANYWTENRFVVSPMTADEYRAAIEKPALERVLFFESEEMVNGLVNEVLAMPGGLPLLSFALSELYILYVKEERKGRILINEDLKTLGGVIGALQSRADAEFAKLGDNNKKQIFKKIILRMISIEGGGLARRQVDRNELIYPNKNNKVDDILNQFINARLFVSGERPDGSKIIEPAHDALVTTWEQLYDWRTEAQDYLPLQRRVSQAAQDWAEATDSDIKKGLLWDGNAFLPQLKVQVKPTGLNPNLEKWLNKTETQFVNASFAEEQRLEEEQERQRKTLLDEQTARAKEAEEAQEQAEADAKRVRNRNRIASGLATLGIGLAIVATIFFFTARQQTTLAVENQVLADDNAATAEAEAARANAQTTLAVENEATAVAEKARADGEAQEAIKAKETAEASEAKAEEQLKASQIQLVLSSSINQFPAFDNPDRDEYDRALLMAVQGINFVEKENYNISDRFVNEQTRRSLSNLPANYTSLLGHEDRVWSVAFSLDGKRLASASSDQTIRLWDLTTEDPSASPTILTGHQRDVRSVAFSLDGERLASASSDQTIRLWDLTAEDPSASPMILTGHAKDVNSVAFSGDGKRLASASSDETIRLWDLTTEDPSASPTILTGHQRDVRSVAFSLDGERLASASSDQTIRLWDLTAEDPSASPTILPSHEPSVWYVAFSLGGERFASVSGDKTIWLWDLTAKDPSASLTILTGHESSVNSVAFSLDGERLISASDDRTIRLWDLTAENPSASPTILTGHEPRVNSMALTLDGERLASASSDRTIRLWDLTAEDRSASPTILTNDDVLFVAFSLDGERLASVSSSDQMIRLWDLTEEDRSASPTILIGHGSGVDSVAFSLDGEHLAAAFLDQTIMLWDLTAEDPSASPTILIGHQSSVFSMAFSMDGEHFASASFDQTIRLWDLTTEDPSASLKILTGHGSSVNAVSFSPDGKRLASGSDEIRLWDVTAEDPSASSTILTGHTSFVNAVAFSMDGTRLASGSDDKMIRLWDLTAEDPSASPTILIGHGLSVNSVAFSIDGTRLASGSYDKTIRLWDLRVEDPSASPTILTGHTSFVDSVAFSMDGERLASGSYDKTIRLWPTLQGMVEIACGKVSRNFAWGEWQEYLSAFPYEKTCKKRPVHCTVPLEEWPLYDAEVYPEWEAERAACYSTDEIEAFESGNG
jgi:WD40 repeat protein